MNDKPQDNDGYVVTEKSEDGADTVIVSTDGVTVYRCPGGLTEDELLD
ncbi:hypothetical protein ABT390_33995 [Streptomyces aurantiacus]|uniref:Uncharacterized protein n=1 Tax=Streptomyces aurantiacus JA 4570 TaxID=1286094 RepID=S3ZVR5_9ACTN|nr:hypothetical protein [Streptomyces aurantiacus]EPH46869.1 hypothetical protein STRAU_0035 [Streptomyces aurantiacus JA 4570]